MVTEVKPERYDTILTEIIDQVEINLRKYESARISDIGMLIKTETEKMIYSILNARFWGGRKEKIRESLIALGSFCVFGIILMNRERK